MHRQLSPQSINVGVLIALIFQSIFWGLYFIYIQKNLLVA